MPQAVDKRKLPSKERIGALMSYIQTLESLLSEKGIELPQRPENLLPLLNHESLVPENPHETSSSSQDQPPSLDTWLAAGGTPEMTDYQLSTTTSNVSTAMEKLTNRVGSMQIAEDGQMHYFGPTSNLHILHVGSLSLIGTSDRQPNLENQAQILRAYGVDRDVDEDFETHLINLYFAWEDPNIPVVDKEIFFRERERCRKLNQTSHKYSEVLTNAMYAHPINLSL